MNILDLISRELSRIAGDFAAYVEIRDERLREQRGRSIAGRIKVYLLAEERVLYPALLAVVPNLPPVMPVHHRRLKARAADALARHAQTQGTALAAMLKLQQEMLRYAQSHERELAPRLRIDLSDRELRLLGGEMLLKLASSRRLREPVAQEEPAAFGSPDSLWPLSGSGGFSRSLFGPGSLPLLCDVIQVGAGAQAFAR
jgi:hypothetical protein